MIEITVHAMPAPQGSKRFVGMSKAGRGIMIESSKKVKPWRQAVVDAAILVMGGAGNGKILGPIGIYMAFTVPKPKSAPKKRRIFPDKKPDLSKLVRATEDALTDAGVFEDDARVVECMSRKLYPNEGQDSLPVPGVVIRVSSFPEVWE